MSVTGTFRFHNVGQGLFYSGRLERDDGREFNFIYDCGAKPSIKCVRNAINNNFVTFTSTSIKKDLDLLVISHLHDDHVNGLKDLLDKVKIHTVVLSYVYTKSVWLQAAKLESTHDEEFLWDFYDDPISWLSKRGVETIFLVGSDDEPRNDQNDTPNDDPNGDDSQENGISLIGLMSINPRPNIIPNDPQKNVCKLMELKNNTVITINGFSWRFCFEYLPVDTGELNLYLQNVVARLKVSSLADVLKDRSTLLDFKKTNSKDIFTGGNDAVNRTSVVVSHEPISKQALFYSCVGSNYFYYRFLPRLCNSCICHPFRLRQAMTILSGDVRLFPGKDRLGVVDSVISKKNKHCLVFQYPHHGGTNDINRFIRLNALFNILSFGINNTYGHPVNEVWCLHNFIVPVNQKNAFEYTIMV